MVLRIVLRALGALLLVASRTMGRVRAAITRDIVIGIETADGVACRFIFQGKGMKYRSGHSPTAESVLRFASSSQALSTLLSRHAISVLYSGLLEGSITVEGNPFHVLWFYDLTQCVLPLALRPSWTAPPGAYTEPSAVLPWTSRVTREPVTAKLDPKWEEAVRQRAKLKMMRVASGEPTLEF